MPVSRVCDARTACHVLDPALRERVERTRSELVSARESAEGSLVVLDLPDCDAATKELLWKRIQEAGD